MFAAAEAAAPTSAFTGIPVHPGEDASTKEEDDWWRIFESVVSGTDAAHWIMGAVPPAKEVWYKPKNERTLRGDCNLQDYGRSK